MVIGTPPVLKLLELSRGSNQLIFALFVDTSLDMDWPRRRNVAGSQLLYGQLVSLEIHN